MSWPIEVWKIRPTQFNAFWMGRVASTNLLIGVVQGGTGRSAAIAGVQVAGKTGTTNDNVDLWFIGYAPTQQLVTGVWLGNDDNSPTGGGSFQAAELWGNYMGKVLQ